MADKKRKRESKVATTNKPRKKTAVIPQHDTITFQVKALKPDEELVPVIAVPSAIKIPKHPFKPYARKEKDRPVGRQQLLLHTSAHPKLDFIGDENFGGDATALLDHYLGVYDPETGTVELHQARRLKVCATLRPTQEQLDDANAKRDYQTASVQRQQLGMEFGTKKARTMIKSLSENAIVQAGTVDGKLDATTQALLDSIGEKVAQMPSAAERDSLANDSAPKPKANLLAKEPKDVYPLGILIPQDTLSSIDVMSWMEKAKKKDAITTGSRFVSYRIQSVATNSDLTKMKVLKYMLVMIELYISLKSGGRGSKKLPPRKELNKLLASSPPSLIDAVLRRFCMASPKEMTSWEVDNLTTHLAALTLYIDGWETDTTDLKEDLRMEVNKLLPYFRELGCRVGGMSDKDRSNRNITADKARSRRMAKLILPLEFPTVGKMRGKGR